MKAIPSDPPVSKLGSLLWLKAIRQPTSRSHLQLTALTQLSFGLSESSSIGTLQNLTINFILAQKAHVLDQTILVAALWEQDG